MNKIEKLIQELCPNGVKFKELGKIAKLTRGRVISKDYLKDNIGDFPVFSSQTANNGEIGKINTYDYDGEFLTWTTDGAYAGTVFYRKGKFSITNVCGLISIYEDVNILYRFLYFWLSISTRNYVQSGMGNPKLMSNVMEKIQIPIPPIEIQKEIVKILDSFTELEAELETNLEAELEKRRKQYAFFRDELLTFDGENKNPILKKFEEKIEWKSLGELYEIKNGLNKSKEFFGKGSPIVNFTDVFKNRGLLVDDINGKVEVTDKEKNLYSAKKNDLFFTRTSETKEDIGMTSALFEDIKDCVFSGFVLRARPKTDLLNAKFVSYYFSSHFARKEIIKNSTFTTRALITGGRISKIQIPIPNKEIQERIVHVLDNFEKICNDFEIGLPAEIEARKKQYEYYRERLLSFDKLGNTHTHTHTHTHTGTGLNRVLLYIYYGVEWKKLGDVGVFVRGNGLPKSDFTESGVGCIHYGEIYTYYGVSTSKTKSFVSVDTAKKLQKVYRNDLIITNTSENLDDVCKAVVWLGKNEIVTGGHASIFRHNEEPKFLAYYTQTNHFYNQKKKFAKGTKVIDVSAKDLSKIIIPTPPIKVQKEIVSILDKLDKLVNNISEGLPAEIKARRKQYEYYREKLLTFKKLEK